MLSLQPRYLSRYVAIGRLLVRYGHADLAKRIGLQDLLAYEEVVRGDTNGRPIQFARDLEEMGPTYIKLGQILSTRADLLPADYLKALERLQDRVEPVPFERVRTIIRDDFGVDVEEAYASFDEQPLACASLGQVHRASLRNGRPVAVKVQRPDVEERVQTDLEALAELARVLDGHTDFGRRYRFTQIVNSLRDTMLRELNYRQEAANAKNLARNLRQFERFSVPLPIDELSSAHVITMEFVQGVKITDLEVEHLNTLDRSGLAEDLFNVYLHQVLINGEFHADPHPGNLMLRDDGRIVLMDFGMVVRLSPQLKQRLVKLLLTIADGEGDETAAVAVEIGHATDEFYAADFRERIARLVVENRNLPVEQMQAGRIVMEIQATSGQCGLLLPNEVTMLGKTLLNLDKVVKTLDPAFNPHRALKKNARRIIQEHSQEAITLNRIFRAAIESGELAEQMPYRLNLITRRLADGEFSINVNAVDQRLLIAGLQKIANRIAAGAVTAAMIIGAAIIMHVDAQMKILGYPVLALILFLGAGFAGTMLIWRTLFHDMRDSRKR